MPPVQWHGKQQEGTTPVATRHGKNAERRASQRKRYRTVPNSNEGQRHHVNVHANRKAFQRILSLHIRQYNVKAQINGITKNNNGNKSNPAQPVFNTRRTAYRYGGAGKQWSRGAGSQTERAEVEADMWCVAGSMSQERGQRQSGATESVNGPQCVCKGRTANQRRSRRPDCMQR